MVEFSEIIEKMYEFNKLRYIAPKDLLLKKHNEIKNLVMMLNKDPHRDAKIRTFSYSAWFKNNLMLSLYIMNIKELDFS